MGKAPSLHSQKAFALSKHENSRDSHRRGTIFKLTILMKGITGKAEENIGIFEKNILCGYLYVYGVCMCAHVCVGKSKGNSGGVHSLLILLYRFWGSNSDLHAHKASTTDL